MSNSTERQTMTMRGLTSLLLAVGAWALWPGVAQAQFTNGYPFTPQTRLEAFETNTGIVVLKATAQIGVITANTGALAVRCRQITDTSTGRSEYGLSLVLGEGSQFEDALLLDYEEIDSLASAIDYFGNLDWSVTSLNGFEAIYTSKGGFRMEAFSSRRSGAIEFSARSLRSPRPPIVLFRDQLAQFRQFLTQAKTKLDSLRK